MANMFDKTKTKVHFVGIGGMGMCGLAEVLVNMGYRVSGSDIAETDITKHLISKGCKVYQGHSADNLTEVDVVVVSSAIKGYNPEVEAARARLIPVIPRAEMLGELMRMKRAVAVAGSHGKTTTTTMLASVLMEAGKDPTAIIGGRVNALGLANARLGTSEYLVAEADESDGSFLTLAPTWAVVTNMDAEHLDHYGTVEKIREAFVNFVNRIPFYGMAALCVDNSGVQSLLPDLRKRFVTYGLSPQATYRARNVRYDGLITKYVAWNRAKELGEIELPMPGQHNVLNSLAVLAICDTLGLSFETIKAGLAKFDGIQRRFTVRGEVGGVTIVDDFAHHPAEIRTTLAGARAAFPGRRIVAAFQPHRYTRTRDQFSEFANSFYDADMVCLCDVFAAGEQPIDGADSPKLVDLIRSRGHGNVNYVAKRADVAGWIDSKVQEGDIVITLGAGNIQLTCNELIDALEKRGNVAKVKNLVVI